MMMSPQQMHFLHNVTLNGGRVSLNMSKRSEFGDYEQRGWLRYQRGDISPFMEITKDGEDALRWAKVVFNIWRDISTAPMDGSDVTTGSIGPLSVGGPIYPITSRFIDGKWTAKSHGGEWHPYDPQPTHWSPPRRSFEISPTGTA